MALERKTWDDYANWEEVAASTDEKFIRRRITGPVEWRVNDVPGGFQDALTKVKEECLERRGRAAHVVDFGCGLGRNAPLLRDNFGRVVGIDLPEMVSKLHELPEAKSYDALYDDLDSLMAAEDIDVLYDSVVLQHMVDEAFVSNLVSKIIASPNLKYVISLCNSSKRAVPDRAYRGWPRALIEMTKLGWKESFSMIDQATFNRPHNLRIMTRPE